MKKVKTHWLFGLLVATLFFSCGQGSAQSSGATEMLKGFYTQYITKASQYPSASDILNAEEGASENAANTLEAMNALRQKYCTSRFLNEMKKAAGEDEYDYYWYSSRYDLFLYAYLNAKECKAGWAESLSISRDSEDADTYSVSFASATVRLKTVKEAGEYKIDAVEGYSTDGKRLLREKGTDCSAFYIQEGKVRQADFHTGHTETLNLGKARIVNIYMSPGRDCIVFLKATHYMDCNVTASLHVYSIKDKTVENIATPKDAYQSSVKWTSDRSFSYVEEVKNEETDSKYYRCTHTMGGKTVKNEDKAFWDNYEYEDEGNSEFVSPDGKTAAVIEDDAITLKQADGGRTQTVRLPFEVTRYGLVAWLDANTLLFSVEPLCMSQCCDFGNDLYLYETDSKNISLLEKDMSDFSVNK
ncbi:MAG: hypothetical protein LBC47_06555 [Tannerella sp.]|jgi:hypothetical protein|nr:hypothetical protein [Tannerella sp.]